MECMKSTIQGGIEMRVKNWSVLGIVLLLIIGLMFGCRSQGQKNSSSGPGGGLGGEPIKIGYSPWPGWYTWDIVQEKGFFKKYGVNVKLVWFPVYSDSLQALATGKIDANSMAISDTLAPATKGLPLKIVMVTDNSCGGDGVVVKPQYKSMADLKGKKVATELGTLEHLLLVTGLQRAGLQESDVQFTNMTINDAGPAFIAGNLDAAALWEPFLSKAIKEGRGKKIFSSADVPGLIADVLVFNADVVKRRPDDVKKIIRAWLDAMEWWKEHPDEGVKIMARKAETPVADYKELLNGVKIFMLEDNLKAFTRADNMQYLGYSAAYSARFLKSKNMLESIPDVEKLLDDSFIRAIAREKK